MAKGIRQLPLVIDIPTPCAADWETMTGDSQVRHCALCNKDVHALSELSEARVVALLKRGDVCVRLQVATNGAVVHQGSKPRRAARVVATAALVALAACGNADRTGDAVVGNQVAVSAASASAVALAEAPPAPSASAAEALPAITGAKQVSTPPTPPAIKHTMGKPMNIQRTMGGAFVRTSKDPLSVDL